MPHTRKKRTYAEKRKIREESPNIGKIKIDYRVLATNIIIAVNNKEITYRDFKLAVEIVDEKFWKPKWVDAPKIKC